MPERLDRVTLTLSGGDVTLSWAIRQTLMARLQHVHSASGIRIAFTAVGGSRAVQLAHSQKAALLKVLEEWSLGRDGYEAMPAGLFDLRNALIDDLHDAAS
jgi:hypothetical protein